jgi:dihydrofolate reductase
MQVAMIVAMDRNRLIGNGNALPWHLPEDLRHFKRITMGKPIVMGRLTHESIGRALPGRKNIVISRDADYRAKDCDVVTSLAQALQGCGQAPEVMIIGGGQIYAEAMPLADRLYLTFIDADFAGDRYFPEISAAQWRMIEQRPGADAAVEFAYEYRIYERVGTS